MQAHSVHRTGIRSPAILKASALIQSGPDRPEVDITVDRAEGQPRQRLCYLNQNFAATLATQADVADVFKALPVSGLPVERER
jgi:hypothetical protein